MENKEKIIELKGVEKVFDGQTAVEKRCIIAQKKYRYGHCLFCGGGYERYRSS